MNTGAREWDAETYETVSDPQFSWGMEVLDRLELNGDEYVLDAGCGTGRVTEKLLERVPDGRVLAVDGSAQMIEKARERFGDRVSYLVSDLAELEVEEPVDVVFSTATFHWLPDHDQLFARLHAALKPGGRVHAQCGGFGNVASHTEVIAKVAGRPEFAPHLGAMKGIWNFARPEETEERLGNAGFAGARCWLEPKPTQPAQPLEFISTVTLGPILAQLPEETRHAFAEAVIAESEQPLVLDYVRLNIEAARP